MAYVYRHIRLDLNEPFYIGIGGISKHDNYRRAYNKVYRSSWWKNIVNKTEYSVEIIFDEVTTDFAKEKEAEFIALYGRKDLGTGCLANLTDGGEGDKGFRHTQQSKNRLSAAKKGKPLPKATQEAAWNKNRGRKKRKKERQNLSKDVIDINTGIIYASTEDVCEIFGYNKRTMWDYLSGRLPNKTSFRYYINKEIVDTLPVMSKVIKTGKDHHSSKKVIDDATGKIFNCVKEAADYNGYTVNQVYQWLRGKNKNKSSLRYL